MSIAEDITEEETSIPLTEEFRPRTFKQVVGQQLHVRQFKTVLDDRTSQAFIFSGPSGVGKTTLALIGAKYVGTAENQLVEVDAATFSGVDDMRSLTSALNYRPLGGKNAAKSLIIDECHRLSNSGWDSILKSVERPPEWVYWFFCTTNLARVPNTIVTRCSVFQLDSISQDDITDYLERVAKAKGWKTPRSVLALCGATANGSPRRGLTALGLCHDAKTREEAAKVVTKIEVDDAGLAHQLAQALASGKGWTVAVQPLLEKMKLAGENPEGVRHVVQAYFTTIIIGEKKDEKVVCNAARMLSEFTEPYNTADGMSPLVLSVCRAMFGNG